MASGPQPAAGTGAGAGGGGVNVALNSSAPQQYYQLYRQSSLGQALIESLDDLISSGHINPQLAMKVLTQFDKSVAQALTTKLPPNNSKATIKSHLQTYNSVDEVWTFKLRNPTFKLENNTETITAPGFCKIVACKAGGGAATVAAASGGGGTGTGTAPVEGK